MSDTQEQEMRVDSIHANIANSKRVLILKHKTESVYIPIWIGVSEAEAIVRKLHDIPLVRPMTHDLFADTLKKMGGKVIRVKVTKIHDDTLYAEVQLLVGTKKLSIDSRPSDAIALAVRLDAPIFVDNDIIDKMSVQVEGEDVSEADFKDQEQSQNSTANPLGYRERKQLRHFDHFLKKLDLGNEQVQADDTVKSDKEERT